MPEVSPSNYFNFTPEQKRIEAGSRLQILEENNYVLVSKIRSEVEAVNKQLGIMPEQFKKACGELAAQKVNAFMGQDPGAFSLKDFRENLIPNLLQQLRANPASCGQTLTAARQRINTTQQRILDQRNVTRKRLEDDQQFSGPADMARRGEVPTGIDQELPYIRAGVMAPRKGQGGN